MAKRSLSYDAPTTRPARTPTRKRVTRRTKEDDEDQEPVTVRESARSVATLTPGALSDLSNLSLEAPTTGWYGYDGLSTSQGFLEARRRQ